MSVRGAHAGFELLPVRDLLARSANERKVAFLMRIMPTLLLGSALLVGTGADAAGLLDFYVGAGAGQSTLRQDYYQIDSHVTGWKVVAGWRPLDMFGAEAEYADFGSKDVTYVNGPSVSGPNTTQISTDAHATAAFALAYLPVPVPWFDLYAKLGGAHVQSNTTARYCAACGTMPTYIVTDSTRTSVAWGAGGQFKFGLPAIRLEYERFSGSQGTDALLTLAVTANF
ncbi:MAG TPA: outer membrane beta-barrel protein [Steroidobacteraceae bacterium]|nr:outer membrane beta-barrel protein [Steroidobacteraceae bacterium]